MKVKRKKLICYVVHFNFILFVINTYQFNASPKCSFPIYSRPFLYPQNERITDKHERRTYTNER